MQDQLPLLGPAEEEPAAAAPLTAPELIQALTTFVCDGRRTERATITTASGRAVPVLANEFWTSKQRAASSLHEISYRACFKPQLPRFFISRLTAPMDVVYDPFMGRGTTVLEAALLGRVPWGCDVNPLSLVLAVPRLTPPTVERVEARLGAIDFDWRGEVPGDLMAFYHPATLNEICALRAYLGARTAEGAADAVDRWIQMVAVNRLTGHSPGFFSVYTLPPNQALSAGAQRKINADRDQTPPRRHVPALILAKTRALLSDVTGPVREQLTTTHEAARFHVGSSAAAFWTRDAVDLVVTSPPFLNVVDYARDNWLRCWFCGIDPAHVAIARPGKLDDWREFIASVFMQLARVLKPGGFVAFEVGEVRAGTIRLEESVIPCGEQAELTPVAVVVNSQRFTKTANIWGVSNNTKGTNTNRIVVFQK